METLTATAASQDLGNLLKKVTEEQKTYQIQHSGGSAILLSQEEYEGLLETLELLSIPGLQDSLRKSQQQVVDDETFSFDEILGDIE